MKVDAARNKRQKLYFSKKSEKLNTISAKLVFDQFNLKMNNCGIFHQMFLFEFSKHDLFF